jgi:uncharacterized protein (DUF885 family)
MQIPTLGAKYVELLARYAYIEGRSEPQQAHYILVEFLKGIEAEIEQDLEKIARDKGLTLVALKKRIRDKSPYQFDLHE